MTRPDRALIRKIHDALAERAIPDKAEQMQAYMKSEMPFLGVSSPERKAAYKEVFRAHIIEDLDVWQATARALWDKATHREHRYAAIGLTGQRPYRPFQSLDILPMYEHFIVDGAWWDYVDEVAIHRVGPLLKAEPKKMAKIMRKWSVDEDHWRRRTSIICQIAMKGEADLDLLYACIKPSIDESDFFLRKGIGWALRQIAWADPDEVIRYVRQHADRLSGLTKREALKNVLKQGLIDELP